MSISILISPVLCKFLFNGFNDENILTKIIIELEYMGNKGNRGNKSQNAKHQIIKVKSGKKNSASIFLTRLQLPDYQYIILKS